jgi:hypothetical protein
MGLCGQILAIRHGHSTANVAEIPSAMTAEDLAFANRSAGLTKRGEAECIQLAAALSIEYGIDTSTTHVAVSEFKRTNQMTKLLGFREEEEWTKPYRVLNEVDHEMELDVLRAMLRRNEIPAIALQTAEATLERSPKEKVWITHGLLIAGLCIVLDIADQYERLVPRQCEVRQLTL